MKHAHAERIANALERIADALEATRRDLRPLTQPTVLFENYGNIDRTPLRMGIDEDPRVAVSQETECDHEPGCRCSDCLTELAEKIRRA